MRRENERLHQESPTRGWTGRILDMEREQTRHRELLRRYYLPQGQDPDMGVPTRQRMEELGLAEEGRRLHEDGPDPAWQGPAPWPLDAYPHGGSGPSQGFWSQAFDNFRNCTSAP